MGLAGDPRHRLMGMNEKTSPTRRSSLIFAAIATVVAVAWALLSHDRTTGAAMAMPMTHYMELLSVQQPWNLLLFMAVPVVLAETLAITELVILLNRNAPAWVHSLSRWAGLVAGPVMIGITVHLLIHAVGPLTSKGLWRGPADVIAVLAYLLGAIPMVGITLVETGLLGRDDHARRRLHVTFVAIFLVVAHIAMIFGMLDPAVMGHEAQPMQHSPSAPASTPMDHSGHHMP